MSYYFKTLRATRTIDNLLTFSCILVKTGFQERRTYIGRYNRKMGSHTVPNYELDS